MHEYFNFQKPTRGHMIIWTVVSVPTHFFSFSCSFSSHYLPLLPFCLFHSLTFPLSVLFSSSMCVCVCVCVSLSLYSPTLHIYFFPPLLFILMSLCRWFLSSCTLIYFFISQPASSQLPSLMYSTSVYVLPVCVCKCLSFLKDQYP